MELQGAAVNSELFPKGQEGYGVGGTVRKKRRHVVGAVGFLSCDMGTADRGGEVENWGMKPAVGLTPLRGERECQAEGLGLCSGVTGSHSGGLSRRVRGADMHFGNGKFMAKLRAGRPFRRVHPTTLTSVTSTWHLHSIYSILGSKIPVKTTEE